MNTDLIGWIFLAVILVWVLVVMPWLIRRHSQVQTQRLHFMLAAVATVADAHRQSCRALIGLGKHAQCPVCHIDQQLWEEVVTPGHRSIHIVELAKHPSWLDPDVEIARIVADKYRETEGGKHP